MNSLNCIFNAFYDCVLENDLFYNYSENVQIFKDAYEEAGMHSMRLTDPSFYVPALELYEFEVFNQLISAIRHKCHSPCFNARVINRQREHNRNFREYSEYVNGLFSRWSRLLVVRIDLSYLVEHDEQNNRTRHLVTLEDVKADLKRLLSNKRHNTIFDDLVGYVWKLEYGDLKGYHYHLILLFNGNNVKGDFKKGKEIGEYWRDVITKGRGYYFNCNGKKSDYAHLGIGMINAEGEEDAHLRFNLIHYVMRYLVKSDQYLKVKLKMNDRSIGKGLMPKKKSNAGR